MFFKLNKLDWSKTGTGRSLGCLGDIMILYCRFRVQNQTDLSRFGVWNQTEYCRFGVWNQTEFCRFGVWNQTEFWVQNQIFFVDSESKTKQDFCRFGIFINVCEWYMGYIHYEIIILLQETDILFNQTMNKKQIFNKIYNFEM